MLRITTCLSIAALLLLVSTVECRRSMRKKRMTDRVIINNCGLDLPIKLNDLKVEPMPMFIDGPVSLDFNGSSTRDITSGKIELTVRKMTWMGFLGIGCINNIGSCTYEDSSTLLDRMKNEDWAGEARNIAEQIEKIMENAGIPKNHGLRNFQKGSVSEKNIILTLRSGNPFTFLSSGLSYVISGNYEMTIKYYQKDGSNEELFACVQIVFSIR